MPHRTPYVCCPKCNGTGKIQLTKPLADAFHFIRSHPGCTVKDYHTQMEQREEGLTMIAAQRRMNALCEMMVAVRKKQNGRFRYYEVQHNAPPPTHPE